MFPVLRPRNRSISATRALSLSLLLILGAVSSGKAQDIEFFRIGTGSTSGTYFPIGGLIAAAMSNPPGSRTCGEGGSCGVSGLIAVAQSTNGSVANVKAIQKGEIESGFSQSDVAYWAYNGQQEFAESGPSDKLRVIANLYPESLHLVVSESAAVFTPSQLKGKRISLDREGSGTRVDTMLVLEAYGLKESDMEALALPPGVAADRLALGDIDGFFLVAGTPAEAVTQLAATSRIGLVPITGEPAEKLLKAYPFFSQDFISPGTYPNVGAVETISVGAQWLVSSDVSDDLVYELTKALWHENTKRLLGGGHPKGALIRIETALAGLSVPLHAGAERYYREIGVLDDALMEALPKVLPPQESGSQDGEPKPAGVIPKEKPAG